MVNKRHLNLWSKLIRRKRKLTQLFTYFGILAYRQECLYYNTESQTVLDIYITKVLYSIPQTQVLSKNNQTDNLQYIKHLF